MKLLLLVLFYIHVTSSNITPVGCLVWRNSFIKIDKETISPSKIGFIFTVHSRQSLGWISIGIFSKPNYFDDSTSILAYLPNNFVQLKNHTTQAKKEEKTIFGETFQNKQFNLIDGIYAFAFKMNSTSLRNKNFFIFSQSLSDPQMINGTIEIPKHTKFSKFFNFQLNSSHSIPICEPELNMAGRILAQHYGSLIFGVTGYIVLGLLFLGFRNKQPMKSRYIGPYIMIGSLYKFDC